MSIQVFSLCNNCVVGGINHEKEITGRGPGPRGKTTNSVEYNEFDIYMAMLNKELDIWVKEV